MKSQYIHINDISIKCNISKWTKSPCFIVDDEAVVITGLTVLVEITIDINVAIVKYIKLFSSHTC